MSFEHEKSAEVTHREQCSGCWTESGTESVHSGEEGSSSCNEGRVSVQFVLCIQGVPQLIESFLVFANQLGVVQNLLEKLCRGIELSPNLFLLSGKSASLLFDSVEVIHFLESDVFVQI